MTIPRYSVNQYQVDTLLTWIKTDHLAIPEIQRPFVWNGAKVRISSIPCTELVSEVQDYNDIRIMGAIEDSIMLSTSNLP